MTECDVDGCTKQAVVEVLTRSVADNRRCVDCLRFDAKEWGWWE